MLVAQYGYDLNGNRTSVTSDLGITINGTYDAQDRLTSYNGATYTYTKNGELQSKTVGSDITTCSYDVLGNLAAVSLPNGSTIEYVVDGQNRRIGKKVNGTLVKGWIWDGQRRIAAELDGAGTVVSRFVYAEGANVPEYMIKGGVTYRILSDHLGSPRLVVDVATGTVAQQIDYDEFGRVLDDSSPGFQPFGFAGGLYDGDTKLVRFGERDYDAEVGRWTSKDPARIGYRDTNSYSYVVSDPINSLDPGGRQTLVRPVPWPWPRSPWPILDLWFMICSMVLPERVTPGTEPKPGECTLQDEVKDNPYRDMLGTCYFKCKESNGRVFEWSESAARWGGYCPKTLPVKDINWPPGPLPPPK